MDRWIGGVIWKIVSFDFKCLGNYLNENLLGAVAVVNAQYLSSLFYCADPSLNPTEVLKFYTHAIVTEKTENKQKEAEVGILRIGSSYDGLHDSW